METLFIKLLNMSVIAGWLVLAVIVFRFLFKKAPKWINCALWGLVGLRLICPFSIESVLSLIPNNKPFSPTLVSNGANTISDEIINNPAPIITDIPSVAQSFDTEEITAFILSAVWIVGIIALAVYALVSYIKIRHSVREAVKIENNIYECDRIDTPFILGVINPKIYLPSSLNEGDREYVLLHETAHLKRKDYIWKPLGFLLLAVYWFNPIIWIAYILLCKDIELACDEKVIKEMGTDIKKSYSSALINCSTHRKLITACPLAFGETSVKTRVKNVLNYKKPAFWVIIIAVIASIVTAVCFMTNPISNNNTKSDNTKLSFVATNTGSDIDGISISIKSISLSGKAPNITVEWKNDTDKTVYFPESFEIYKYKNGTLVSCATEELIFNSIANILMPHKTREMQYPLSSFDLSKADYYYFRVKVDNNKYVWADFELTQEKTYSYSRVLYVNGIFSFDPNAPENIAVSESNELIVKENSEWVTKGNLSRIKLTKNNFDNFCTDGSEWDKSTAAGIRKNAEKAYKIVDKDKNQFYYMLLLKDDNAVLCYGIDNTIRRADLYSETDVSISETEKVPKIVRKIYIDATVLEVNENSVLVNEYGKEYGEIYVSLDKLKNIPVLSVGDKVRIYYTGGVAESYPGQINKAMRIEVLESNVSVYTYNESPEPVKPRIELHPDYNFVFIDSYLSSEFAYTGKYEVSQSELRLKTDDGKFFVFDNNGDETFIFNAERSSELQKYRYSENGEFISPVPDGAVFKLKQ